MKNQTGSDKNADTSNGMKNLRFLLGYIKPYKWVFIIGLFSLAVSALSILAIPKVLGQLINEIGLELEAFKLARNKLIGAAALLLLIQGVFSFLRVYTFTYVMENGMAGLRKELFDKIMQSRIEFFDQQRVGALMSRLTADVSTVQDTFSIHLAELLRQFITVVVGTILLMNISWKLTATMFLSVPIFILLAFVFGRFIRKISKMKQDALAASNVIAEEAFGNIRVVKAFNQETSENKRYGSTISDVIRIAIKGAAYRGSFISFIVVGLFGVIFLLFFQGVNLSVGGGMEVGDLVEFIFYTGFIGGSIAGLGDLATKLQGIVGSTDRIVEILHEKDANAGLIDDTLDLKGDIALTDVSFHYPTREEIPVLQGITIQINAGETVALVGHSGAGKSTIFQLLLQFYKIQQGSIHFDNNNASEFHPAVIRDHISIVPQEVILFGGTIRENIAYGRQDASGEDIMNAARQANAWDFINDFPEGMETVVGERGIKLSGGQRQRIAIARAILKDPEILLLDEATSSLDAESEKLIQEALEHLMKDRTTLIIAHRLSTIRNADKILVMNNGRIIENGDHETLIKNEDGLYKYLLKLQYQIA
ncbi:MAG: ATP-binding cassette domain-containing protein [Bacteroidetes bacterium]|nr:ATP-binding cassette domain-containing protein [Bacteroidota bacterium]